MTTEFTRRTASCQNGSCCRSPVEAAGAARHWRNASGTLQRHCVLTGRRLESSAAGVRRVTPKKRFAMYRCIACGLFLTTIAAMAFTQERAEVAAVPKFDFADA